MSGQLDGVRRRQPKRNPDPTLLNPFLSPNPVSRARQIDRKNGRYNVYSEATEKTRSNLCPLSHYRLPLNRLRDPKV